MKEPHGQSADGLDALVTDLHGEAPPRREVLKWMGASVGLAGVTSCTRQPVEPIVPWGAAPEATIPGKPRYFATTLPAPGGSLGVLVESHEGRPTKIEGNPDHPSSLGAVHAVGQAAVLGLYDPDRSQVVSRAGQVSTWDAFETEWARLREEQSKRRGAGLRFLSAPLTSPTAADQVRRLRRKFPLAHWHQYEAVNRDSARAGALAAFGADSQVLLRLERATVVLALDSDFLVRGPGAVRHARDFAQRRRDTLSTATPLRLYSIESSPTLTGARADHRLAVQPGRLGDVARRLAAKLGVAGVDPGATPELASAEEWLNAAVSDLQSHRGQSLVTVGDEQPAWVHTLVHRINKALGAVGQTLELIDPVDPDPLDQTASLRELCDAMRAGSVEVLVVTGANPVYDAPADLGFAEALEQVPTRVHHGLYDDETADRCHWHLPATHTLEEWSDARAHDGTASLVQPLIAPLYGGRSLHELLALAADEETTAGYELVREYWRGEVSGRESFDQRWRAWLHAGVIPDTAFAPRNRTASDAPLVVPERSAADLEVLFRPDPTVGDGRLANCAWLQELPKPLTLTTWDNTAWISPATAAELEIENGDELRLRAGESEVTSAAWIVEGQPDGTLTVHLGYGRRRAGSVGTGAGTDVYPLRSSASPWLRTDVTVERTGERIAVACTQTHHSMEGRDIVRTRKASELHGDGAHHEAEHGAGHHPDLLTPHEYDGHAWGMVIDIASCTGCSACVVACQSENNIPVVGKQEVLNGREMHWLRVDRYYEEQEGEQRVHHQPVPCMHCEQAPCEVVCPVAATTHSDEGLNEMTYNRCVGTRYCANNCPYKVRRFNFFQYADTRTESLAMLANPDVTVRSRGVMEKCTYCVQRINQARIQAKREGRDVREGEVVTACQATCPAQAISFGDLNDPNSAVSRARAEERNYGLLEELNTKPRTTYLTQVRNPNEELGAS